jgi:radical SAM protein (TIGR01212 family)
MAKYTLNDGKYAWGNSRRYNAAPEYFRMLFGARVQKVSIDAGFTCPNRDGTKGTGGCIYCNNKAFNPSYCLPEKPVKQQITEGIEFLRHRYRRTGSYLAYFQAYSNTYAPLEVLKRLFNEALDIPDIKGIIIGTRPDCVDDEKLDYLKDLAEDHFISVEYGIESCYNKTLLRINRGHTFEEAEKAVRMTSERGIITGAHFIFGLPGETREEMLEEASVISGLPLDTVKFHQMQIIKGTPLYKEFRDNPSTFDLFSWDEYLDFIISFIERLNPSIVVERLTGEAPPRFLDGEVWGRKRTDQLINLIEKRLEELDTYQGRLYKADITTVGLQEYKTPRL